MTQSRPDVATRDEYFDRWASLHGGHDPRSSALTRAWLSLVYAVARPLARAGVGPGVVTFTAPVLAGAAVAVLVASTEPAGGWALAAAVLVAASGVVDNVDGAVAVLSARTTRWGFVLDSMVDRLCDGLYLVALWAAGAPGWVCVVGGALMGMQEYVRARAAQAGMTGIGVVTVWERPTRVILTAMFLLGAAVYPTAAASWAAAGSVGWALLGVVGCTQVVLAVRARLRSAEAIGEPDAIGGPAQGSGPENGARPRGILRRGDG